MTDLVRTERADGVLEVRLNRPEKKNALTAEMYQALGDALEGAQSDPDVRVVLLYGEGDAFTAGNDLGDFLQRTGDGLNSPTRRFLELLANSPKPLVAAVHGFAVGIGTTLLLHCDLVYAAQGTRLHLPFVSLGIVPEAASSLLLPARIGYARAAEMLMLAEPIFAEQGFELGIVSAVFPAGELLEQARARARRLAALPREALLATKSLMRRPERERIAEQMGVELRVFAERLQSAEARAAIEAFFQSRARR